MTPLEGRADMDDELPISHQCISVPGVNDLGEETSSSRQSSNADQRIFFFVPGSLGYTRGR